METFDIYDLKAFYEYRKQVQKRLLESSKKQVRAK